MSVGRDLDCATIRDLAPEFVMGTLDEETAASVRAHLADCPDGHAEIAELGGVLPYLAESLDPVAPRPELRGRLLALARDSWPRAAAAPGAMATRMPGARAPLLGPWVRMPRLAWAVTAAAVSIAVALGTLSFAFRIQLDESEQNAAALRRALAAAAEPGARVALLRGTDEAPGASGLAVVTSGSRTIVVEGLLAAPVDHYYEAWYISGEVPRSAGRLDLQANGTGVLAGPTEAGPIDQVAVTLEPVNGGPGPDGPIYASGLVETNPT